jgi:hypothetical protein
MAIEAKRYAPPIMRMTSAAEIVGDPPLGALGDDAELSPQVVVAEGV